MTEEKTQHCPECGGTGEVPCLECGNGAMMCPECNGEGEVNTDE